MKCPVAASAVFAFLAAYAAAAQPNQNFTGAWRLDASRSRLNDPSVPADSFFRAQQSASSLTLITSLADGRPGPISVYPLDGRSEKYQTGDLQKNTATKWEGAALLVNTIVTSPEAFSITERWERSNDGRSLTVTRNVVRRTGETESVLVYANAAAPQPAALIPRPVPNAIGAPSASGQVVPAGTHILLRLTNALDTKHAAPGDRVYLETAVPVFINGRLIVPVGSYVSGTVTEAKEAGRVKGKASLTLQYDSLTLRSGIARDLRSRPDSVDTNGNLDRTEGRISGEGNKAGDAGTVAKTTAIGTGAGAVIGNAAGHIGMGTGIGAAGGAVAGLARVFASRGPQVVLPRGTTMDMVLDRDLHYSDEELRARPQ